MMNLEYMSRIAFRKFSEAKCFGVENRFVTHFGNERQSKDGVYTVVIFKNDTEVASLQVLVVN